MHAITTSHFERGCLMGRLRAFARGLLAVPRRALRSLRGSSAKPRALLLKIAAAAVAVGFLLTLFFGWRTFSMLQRLSSEQPFATNQLQEPIGMFEGRPTGKDGDVSAAGLLEEATKAPRVAEP